MRAKFLADKKKMGKGKKADPFQVEILVGPEPPPQPVFLVYLG